MDEKTNKSRSPILRYQQFKDARFLMCSELLPVLQISIATVGNHLPIKHVRKTKINTGRRKNFLIIIRRTVKRGGYQEQEAGPSISRKYNVGSKETVAGGGASSKPRHEVINNHAHDGNAEFNFVRRNRPRPELWLGNTETIREVEIGRHKGGRTVDVRLTGCCSSIFWIRSLHTP